MKEYQNRSTSIKIDTEDLKIKLSRMTKSVTLAVNSKCTVYDKNIKIFINENSQHHKIKMKVGPLSLLLLL